MQRQDSLLLLAFDRHVGDAGLARSDSDRFRVIAIVFLTTCKCLNVLRRYQPNLMTV